MRGKKKWEWREGSQGQAEAGKARTLLSDWEKGNEDRRWQPVTSWIGVVDMRRHQMLWAGCDVLL